MPTSSPVSDELRAFAEAPDRYTLLSDDVQRHADERFCLVQGPTWAAVSDVRVAAGEIEDVVAEARRLTPPEKTTVWWLGPSTQPPDLHERLEALGFTVPADRHASLYAMASASEPPPGPPEIDVRVVDTYDDFVVATTVAWDGFAIPEERRERERPHLRRLFEAAGPRTFLAYLEGEPAGVGRSVYSDRGVFLIGGAVLEHARSRGVYRALVRARWDDAVRRGTPGLIVEALPDTSYPILKRLGFEDVCVVRRLEDVR